MKIISQDDQTIVVQREEFIVNLNAAQITLTAILLGLGALVLSPRSRQWVLPEFAWDPNWHNRENPLFIGITIMGVVVALVLALDKIWQAVKSPVQIRLWDTYTFDQTKDKVESRVYQWSQVQSLGAISEIVNIEVMVDIEYRSEANDPDNIDMSPTSLYKVIATFKSNEQEVLERNAIPLASREEVQQLFRQKLAETNQAVSELRDFLGLPSPSNE
jgi:hypothetical protein